MLEIKTKPGSAMLLVILVLALLFSLSAALVRISYNYLSSLDNLLVYQQAFYLAEAGLEQAKVEIASNNNWYTDLAWPKQDDVTWLTEKAYGQTTTLGQGSFKVVREQGKNRVYALGSPKKSLVILKLEFTCPPFKSICWQEL